ncbi:MAG TPA: 2-hydroxyacid dehydrogenase [Edaphobacter sp.]|jgi:phosphoglycerate dehydrogenase-like enzyme|nr:2-hydroxyacid dehydrogenase [Edaphobacter sp.]
MVRVGIDEAISPELLKDFPPEAEIVRIPPDLNKEIPLDFWILPYFRKDAAAAFSHFQGVKVIQALMAGVDWVIPWVPHGVTLCDGRGIHDISTSEWVLAAILSAQKHFPHYRDLQNRRQWRSEPSATDSFIGGGKSHPGLYRILSDDLSEKTVLIVGYGSIGAAIEARLQPFGARVIRVARTAKTSPQVFPVSELQRLLPDADIVVAITPLTAETTGLFSTKEFDLMKPGALLINAARGPVVKTDALLHALQAHKIQAVLDVTDPEPLPADHPLWSAPNCFITPHIAGSTPEFIHRAFRFGAAQVRRYLNGQPLENIVTSAGY